MRLAMVYDYAFREDGGLWTDRAYGRYVDALAPHFDRLVLAAPHATPTSHRPLAYCLRAVNVDLLALPFFERWLGSPLAILRLGPALLRERKRWDVLYVRLPCPLALPTFVVARLLRRPLCLHVVGDLLAAMADYPLIIRPLARLVGYAFDYLTKCMASYALTITQGEALAKRYGHPAATSVSLLESTISDQDLCAREVRALQSPIRLLYVGALLEKKGLRCLIEAVGQLRREMDVQLLLVGSGPDDTEFRKLAAQLELGTTVRFMGSINSERELFQAYRMADLFVLPSLAEGVPRVLIEAMAQSVPVISTRVGGIPGLICNGWNGILVEPGSTTGLSAGIKAVVRDDRLRRQLVANGIATARRLTREAHAREFVRLLKQYLVDQFPDKVAAWENPDPQKQVVETNLPNR
ncbi:MAG: glycosyltransferase [Candidatus Binatia bacterium]